MATTSIEWTRGEDGTPGFTWNPTTGCDQVSPGCDHCYAMTMAKRLKGMGSEKYQHDGDSKTSGPGFGITEHPTAVNAPLTWRKPRKVFVNSMSDLFHAGVSDEFIARVWAVMAATPQHTYQVLTKRHGRMRSLLNSEEFDIAVANEWCKLNTTAGALLEDHTPPYPLPNVWLGTSVEDQKRADLRIPALLQTPAAVRFLSCEPLLGQVDLSAWLYHAPWSYTEFGTDCDCGAPIVGPNDECNGPKLHWIIAGGESGRGHRPVEADWVRMIRDYCQETGTAFLFKQWGGATPKANGRELDGRTWDEYPAVAA